MTVYKIIFLTQFFQGQHDETGKQQVMFIILQLNIGAKKTVSGKKRLYVKKYFTIADKFDYSNLRQG